MPLPYTRTSSSAAPVAGPSLRRARLRAGVRYWVLIPLATIGSGRLLDLLLPPWQLGGWSLFAAMLLVAAGMALVQKATRDLAILGAGTPAPQAPARRLVTAGSYAWCRHPMLFGYNLAAWGIGLLLASPGMLLVSLPVMLALQLRCLVKEERRLAGRFPRDWPQYRARVPLLVPRLFPLRGKS